MFYCVHYINGIKYFGKQIDNNGLALFLFTRERDIYRGKMRKNNHSQDNTNLY